MIDKKLMDCILGHFADQHTGLLFNQNVWNIKTTTKQVWLYFIRWNWAAGIYACDNTPIFRFFQISKRTQTKGSDSQKYKSGKFSYYMYIKPENGKLPTPKISFDHPSH